jgi:hypothetical protein
LRRALLEEEDGGGPHHVSFGCVCVCDHDSTLIRGSSASKIPRLCVHVAFGRTIRMRLRLLLREKTGEGFLFILSAMLFLSFLFLGSLNVRLSSFCSIPLSSSAEDCYQPSVLRTFCSFLELSSPSKASAEDEVKSTKD